jgi:hypothetical protein
MTSNVFFLSDRKMISAIIFSIEINYYLEKDSALMNLPSEIEKYDFQKILLYLSFLFALG